MLTQEQNKIKVEITLVFELELTVALDDSSRNCIYIFIFFNWAGNRENRMVKAGKDKRGDKDGSISLSYMGSKHSMSTVLPDRRQDPHVIMVSCLVQSSPPWLPLIACSQTPPTALTTRSIFPVSCLWNKHKLKYQACEKPSPINPFTRPHPPPQKTD